MNYNYDTNRTGWPLWIGVAVLVLLLMIGAEL